MSSHDSDKTQYVVYGVQVQNFDSPQKPGANEDVIASGYRLLELFESVHNANGRARKVCLYGNPKNDFDPRGEEEAEPAQLFGLPDTDLMCHLAHGTLFVESKIVDGCLEMAAHFGETALGESVNLKHPPPYLKRSTKTRVVRYSVQGETGLKLPDSVQNSIEVISGESGSSALILRGEGSEMSVVSTKRKASIAGLSEVTTPQGEKKARLALGGNTNDSEVMLVDKPAGDLAICASTISQRLETRRKNLDRREDEIREREDRLSEDEVQLSRSKREFVEEMKRARAAFEAARKEEGRRLQGEVIAAIKTKFGDFADGVAEDLCGGDEGIE
ncbi:hypothetical protein BJ508DRAFT_326827 [Ascobolus immersus RN42]|uniref:Uncharacterized protein n=1 Tax=Ascobolus immersus RN42 TaxID=1160509 RepID=A0A3N4I4K5_ASCIM|nr:hypothetical protein BJ508DRAFT_326827 [Ascobolus immersus RN42]